MNLKDLKGKQITVLGLGLHGGGVGTAKFLVKAGAKVLVTDIKKKEELISSLKTLKGLPIKYVLGQHRTEDFKDCDLVIKSPAIPATSKHLEEARKNNIPIETDIGLFFKLAPSRQNLIGITGTKGKSTTSSLIYEILKREYRDVTLVGNIGISVLEKLPQIKKNTLVVMELSSWQLEGLRQHKMSPHVSVVLNVMPDHLDRHKSITDYIEAKKFIFVFQKPTDILVLNYDNNVTKSFASQAKGKCFFFTHSSGIIEGYCENGAYLKNGGIIIKKEEVCKLTDIKLPGWHNVSNILAAATVGQVCGVSVKNIKKAIKGFEGLKGRLEFIKEINGVKFYNDTTATTPEAAIAALNSFPLNSYKKRIVLIAGGADKNLDFYPLVKKMLAGKIKAVILFEGEGTKKIEEAVREQVVNNKHQFSITKVSSMQEAVRQADLKATIGDVVLLTPACASFGIFNHEFDRGAQFVEAVKNLKSNN